GLDGPPQAQGRNRLRRDPGAVSPGVHRERRRRDLSDGPGGQGSIFPSRAARAARGLLPVGGHEPGRDVARCIALPRPRDRRAPPRGGRDAVQSRWREPPESGAPALQARVRSGGAAARCSRALPRDETPESLDGRRHVRSRSDPPFAEDPMSAPHAGRPMDAHTGAGPRGSCAELETLVRAANPGSDLDLSPRTSGPRSLSSNSGARTLNRATIQPPARLRMLPGLLGILLLCLPRGECRAQGVTSTLGYPLAYVGDGGTDTKPESKCWY